MEYNRPLPIMFLVYEKTFASVELDVILDQWIKIDICH